MKSRCIPQPSARFVAKMEDVLSVYQRPYDPKHPQVCLDEIHKTLRSTPRGNLPVAPGVIVGLRVQAPRQGQCVSGD